MSKNIQTHSYVQWSDFGKACELLRSSLPENEIFSLEMKKKKTALELLRGVPVWLRRPGKVWQTNLFDLYQLYLNPSSLGEGLNLYQKMDISFLSGTGPFQKMAITECLNPTTHQDFVLLGLMNKSLPQRGFRLRFGVRILLEYAERFEKSALIQLEQMTDRGFLLSLPEDVQQGLASSMRFYLDTQLLTGLDEHSLRDIEKQFSSYRFNLFYSMKREDSITVSLSGIKGQKGIDYNITGKTFYFVPYEAMEAHDSSRLKVVRDFMTKAQGLALREFEPRFSIKSA